MIRLGNGNWRSSGGSQSAVARPDASARRTVKISEGVRESFWLQGMMAGLPASYFCIKAFSETDQDRGSRQFRCSVTVEMLVLGSGEAGKFLAWHMAKEGLRSVVIERKLIGGSCPNTNCLPSKNEIWSAKVADLVRHADRFGTVAGAAGVNMARVLARKRDMIDGLIAMHLDLYKASGAELIMGTGQFVAPKTIEVSLNDGGTRVLTGDRVVSMSERMRRSPTFPGSRRLRRLPILRRSNSIGFPST
jgi:hypothetical protein